MDESQGKKSRSKHQVTENYIQYDIISYHFHEAQKQDNLNSMLFKETCVIT